MTLSGGRPGPDRDLIRNFQTRQTAPRRGRPLYLWLVRGSKTLTMKTCSDADEACCTNVVRVYVSATHRNVEEKFVHLTTQRRVAHRHQNLSARCILFRSMSAHAEPTSCEDAFTKDTAAFAQ